MTHVTKESLSARIAELESGTRSIKEDYQLEAYRMLLKVMEDEPVAYITYKGYLLHASDPKVLEHSEPTPLYEHDYLHKNNRINMDCQELVFIGDR